MASDRTRELLRALLDALDYRVLGEVYCDFGGEAFWREHRAAVFASGLAWVDALAGRLANSGQSLYVGAGVAEVAPLLAEVLDLDRTVVATSLRAVECDALNAGLGAVGVDPARLRFEARDAADVAAGAVRNGTPFDHIALVSVLTDPECWPMVSGVTYGRLPPVLLDLAAFEAERTHLCELTAAVLGALALPGLVTTTVDEASWILHWAAQHGVEVLTDQETVESPLVGDPIGFLRLGPPAA